MAKNLNDNNLLPTLKNIHNLKDMEFEIFRNSKYFSKFQKSFTTCKWGVMYMTYKTSCILWYKKQKPKVVNIFWYDSKLW